MATVTQDVFKLNRLYDIIVEGCVPDRSGCALWVWGIGTAGSLGLNTVTSYSSPVQLSGTTWCCVSVGQCSMVALKNNGTLWAWGVNTYGQIGDNTIIAKSSPIQIPGTNWCGIFQGNNSKFWDQAGSASTFAGKTDGTLWAWGRNTGFGQLGDNTILDKSSPVQIPGTTWSFGPYKSPKNCYATSVALKSDGTLWAWGYGIYGQLGDNTILNKSSPVQVPGTTWSVVASGSYASGAIKTDGTLWTWGGGGSASILGITNIGTLYSSPVQVPGTTWLALTISGNYATTPNRDFAHALKTDGTLWAWGYNRDGTIGDNTRAHRSSPVQVPGTNWKALGTPSNFSGPLAFKTDGTMWVIGGWNAKGHFGDNTIIAKSSPIQIPGTNWLTVSSGGYASTAGLKTPY